MLHSPLRQNAACVSPSPRSTALATHSSPGQLSDKFMTEAKISVGKTGVARLHPFDTSLARPIQHVPGKNLLGKRHRPRLGINDRQRDLLLHSRHIKVE